MGGLKGGEWNSAMVGFPFLMIGGSAGTIGKIAEPTAGAVSREWAALMYGWASWLGAWQQDWGEGIVFESH